MDQVTSTGRESAKQRARRIPLDYHRQPTRLDRAKWRLTWIVAAAAGMYVVWLLAGWRLGWPSAARQFSPAPVAGVHAAWDGNCAACHVVGANVRSDAGAIALLAAPLARGEGSPRQVADGQCSACHSGPAHHENQIAAEIVSCAACHRDHQGPNADLTRVADVACTACHSDLSRHQEQGKKSIATGEPFVSVASWGSHPEFRSLGGKNQASFIDPGRLKFNHALHMLPGQAPADAVENAKRKWGSIDAADRAGLLAGRNQPVDDRQPVQLACDSCHQLDSAASGDGVPALGAYMQPIRFQKHCAACHRGELAVDADQPNQPTPGHVPHGLKAAEIRHFMAGLLQPLAPPKPLSPRMPLQPIPGKTPGENLAQTIDQGAGEKIASAETRLAGEHRCGKCHEFAAKVAGESMPEIEPTSIPTVWLKHARFDHAAHRAVQCIDCHEAKFFEPPPSEDPAKKPPLDGQMPMIPGRETCARCHGPAIETGAAGARFDCVECHRYHGGGLGPHGKGERQRGVPQESRQGIDPFISGERSRVNSTTGSAIK